MERWQKGFIYEVTVKSNESFSHRVVIGSIGMITNMSHRSELLEGKLRDRSEIRLTYRRVEPCGYLIRLGDKVWDGVEDVHEIPGEDGAFIYLGNEKLSHTYFGVFNCHLDFIEYFPNHKLMIINCQKKAG